MILDKPLIYKEHCKKTNPKVNTRNCLLRILEGSAWGAKPLTVRTTFSQCFSAGEYASVVWCRSAYVKKLDITLNETCRIITGYQRTQ